MKNIHLLPTEKPSRLACDFDKLILNSRLLSPILYKTKHIYITNDEEIKEGDWIFEIDNSTINIADKDYYRNEFDFKIILTTDQDLIKDGVQAIPDDFLEWFVKNPSCEEVETFIFGFDDSIICHSKKYEIIIPKEEPKQETLEEATDRLTSYYTFPNIKKSHIKSVIKGIKWKQEKSYSEEDIKLAFEEGFNVCRCVTDNIYEAKECFNEWFNRFKKK